MSCMEKIKIYISPFKLILGIEVLLLVYSLCQYVRPLHQYTYSGTELSGDYCKYFAYSDEYGMGCYLDNSLITDDSVDASFLYIATPRIDLPKGSYQVTIVYDTDGEGQKYSTTSKYRTYSAIAGHERISLSNQNHKASFSFFSPIKVEEYQVHVDYSGSGYLFVESINICETNAWKNILLFYVILISFIVDIMVLGYRKLADNLRREARITIAILIALTLFTSVPIFTYFMPSGDDLPFHLNRIEAIKESILAGQVPNRVSSFWNNGYGYASAVFYGELFLYLPALLRILGFSVQAAYKFYIVGINLATALLSYYCFKKIFKDSKAVLIGCCAYMLAPYRLVSIFLRGAVGEYTAMVFFPLIFYGLFRIYTEETNDAHYKTSWLPALLGYTGILQCHILSCVMIGIFTGIFCLVFIKRTLQPKRFCQLFKVGTGTVLLNLWFLLPFLDYFRLGYTSVTGTNNPLGRFNSNGALLSQMISIFQAGTGPSYSIDESFIFSNERNYALGGGFLLVIVIYIICRLYQGENHSFYVRIGDYSLGFAAASLFMSTLWFPWDWIQQMNRIFRMITQNIQLPWRFLGVSSFFLAILTICLIFLLKSMSNKYLIYSITAVICSFFVLSAGYFMDDFSQNASFCRYLDGNDLDSASLGQGEYIPDDTPQEFDAFHAAISGASLEIKDEYLVSGTYVVECSNFSDEDTYVDIPFLPYKGYDCTDNETGKKMEIQLNIPGKVRVMIPAHYNGTLMAAFHEPWYWRASEMISIVTLTIGIVYLVFGKKANSKFRLWRRSHEQ